MNRLRTVAWIAVAMIVVASCSSAASTEPSTLAGGIDTATALLAERIDAIDAAVVEWRGATSIEEAQGAAEVAANLVVGPNGPGYGDRNEDGVIGGASEIGVLAGVDGSPAGLATLLAPNACVLKDVLGGSWDDPDGRWDEMASAIERWRPNNNTMPSLASHPMRVVGWATFTLATESLDKAHEYAGHANIHVVVSRRALDC
ncbi:MAG: hypothetical protein M3132_13000 [Actinomycetia bacterium]|nr:hypothetical protein [Actinomycetes bacterium]